MRNFTDALIEDFNIVEDLNKNPGIITTENAESFANSRFGGCIEQGTIKRLVPIRDEYEDDEMYEALASMVMRVCVNLHHKEDIQDMGWYYCQDRTVVWGFRYKSCNFIFVGSPKDKRNSFDIYKSFSDNPRRYYDLVTANHPWCTNARDVNYALELEEKDLGVLGVSKDDDKGTEQEKPHKADEKTVRDIVRQAIKDELRGSIKTAVTSAVTADVGDMLRTAGRGYGSAARGSYAGGNDSYSGGTVVDDSFIERLVDAVIVALKKNGII